MTGFGYACNTAEPVPAPLAWEEHKPRVWRLYGKRVRCTVTPSLERREWLWVVERTNGVGITAERARGRGYTRTEAMDIGESVVAQLDRVETRRNRARYGGSP